MFAFVFASLIAGCASVGHQESAAQQKAPGPYRLTEARLELAQDHRPDIDYFDEQELQQRFGGALRKRLTDKGFLTDRAEAPALKVRAKYIRHFVGEGTPLATDSLGYPGFAYRIEVGHGQEPMAVVERDKLTYKGGMLMNIKVMAGGLRKREHEEPFIEALAAKIVSEVERLQ